MKNEKRYGSEYARKDTRRNLRLSTALQNSNVPGIIHEAHNLSVGGIEKAALTRMQNALELIVNGETRDSLFISSSYDGNGVNIRPFLKKGEEGARFSITNSLLGDDDLVQIRLLSKDRTRGNQSEDAIAFLLMRGNTVQARVRIELQEKSERARVFFGFHELETTITKNAFQNLKESVKKIADRRGVMLEEE